MTPLHSFGQWIRQALLTIPLPLVKVLFIATLVGLLIWVLLLPASRTQPEGGTRHWDENLKIAAGLALIIQIVIYSML